MQSKVPLFVVFRLTEILNIMQSIFRPASRREMLGEHAGDGRRDGGLKMGWTKRSGVATAMGIDCRLDLG